MPRQWIYIALYMVLAYLAFAACIEIARRQVAAEVPAPTARDGGLPAP